MTDHVVTPRQDGLTWRRVADEIVVLDIVSSHYFSFNSTAALLWERLTAEGGLTDSALSEQLVGEFDISQEQADADVAVFLADCRERGLLA